MLVARDDNHEIHLFLFLAFHVDIIVDAIITLWLSWIQMIADVSPCSKGVIKQILQKCHHKGPVDITIPLFSTKSWLLACFEGDIRTFDCASGEILCHCKRRHHYNTHGAKTKVHERLVSLNQARPCFMRTLITLTQLQQIP
jgi:hypothetical protein